MEVVSVKNRKKLYPMFWWILFCLLIINGCFPASNLKMPESLPPVIRNYKHVTIPGGRAGMKSTGVYLKQGTIYTIIATGGIDYWPGHRAPADFRYHDVRPELGWPLIARIGDNYHFRPFVTGVNSYTRESIENGELFLGYRSGDLYPNGEPKNFQNYKDDIGFFNVDIFVWEKKDWVQIADFLEKMKEKDPQNMAINNALDQAKAYRKFYLASLEAEKEIEATKQEIEVLKEEPKAEKEQIVKKSPEARPLPQTETPKKESHKIEVSKVEAETSIEKGEKENRIALLEEKLNKLMETLAQLEETKKEFEEEKKKSQKLTDELAEKEKREQELLVRLKDGSKTPPVIVIASPKDEGKVEVNIIQISGVAEDEEGLARVEIFINGKPMKKMKGDRGIMITEERNPKRFDIKERLSLENGINRIKIRAVDADGLTSERIMTVQYVQRRKNIWAVVIGINDYPKIRRLKYAVNDAKIVHDHLVNHSNIPIENVTLLLDQDATLTKIRSALGTHLKKKAGKDDMVIIFFAGHGATEKDVMSPDGDGLEKYLLPYNADPNDLYATALPMGEISKIFDRIRSERLVFIADSCYSGASGGRTIGITGVRANISDTFFDRLASGKGRVIISASGGNEVSAEDDKLEHGVFTYYLVEGWRGKADADQDGVITVDEVYRYVSEHVPRATGQEQHPVKKGTVEGRLILGVVQ
jgi:hypothetical protein